MRGKIIVLLVLLALVVLAVSASADRIILAPAGTTLDAGEIKAEAAISPTSDTDTKIYWLNVGLQRLELSAMRLDIDNPETGRSATSRSLVDEITAGTEDVNVFGAELSILPETTLTPGIGVGVWDITNDTPDGRGYYVALTKVVPLTREIPTIVSDVRVHAGFGIKGVDGFFGGAEATIPLGLRLYAEYFQKEFNFAVGWGLIPSLKFKVHFLDGETFYGLQFSPPL